MYTLLSENVNSMALGRRAWGLLLNKGPRGRARGIQSD